jgi:DNA-3-methyladenine glycosylase
MTQLDPDADAVDAARSLLGWTIACRGTAAVITEVEAYHEGEAASHSFGGLPTSRTAPMFGPAGSAYVYLSYGVHRCVNVVVGPAGRGDAVLLRAAMVVHGEQLVRARRAASRGVEPGSLPARDLLAGPGRLGEGLDVRLSDSGLVLVRPDATDLQQGLDASVDGPCVWYDVGLAASAGIGLPLGRRDLLVGPRVGITKATELAWRFGIRGTIVSRGFPG